MMKKKQSTSKRNRSGTVDMNASSLEALEQATGTKDSALQIELFKQLLNALYRPEGLDEEKGSSLFKAALSQLQGIKPTDEIEGMLATQMVATHAAVMECLRRAMHPNQSFVGRDQNLKHAAKLLAIYARQIEVLDKHRGKGQQKVTVEHVHVEAGGQAVVGNVETGSSVLPSTKRGGSKLKAVTENTPETIDMEVGSKKRKRRRDPSKRTNGVKSQT